MQRLNVSLRKNNDNDLYYNDSKPYKNEMARNNFTNSVKTMNHRTNRQNISTTEYAGVPIKKILNTADNKPNSSQKNRTNNKETRRKYQSESENESSEEEYIIKKRKEPNMNKYVEYIKNNMLSKSKNYDEDRLKPIDSETDSDTNQDSETSDQSDKSDQSYNESNRKIKLNETHFKLREESGSVEISSFKMFSKLEPIILDIKVAKHNMGIKFIFSINNKSIKAPFYLLNYQMSREIFLGTLTKKKNDYDLERVIEYNKLEFHDNYAIKFNIIDIYSDKVKLIQEIEIDMSKLLDKSISKNKNKNKHDKYKSSKSQTKKVKYIEESPKYKYDKNNKNDKNKKTNIKREIEEVKPKVLKKSKDFRC